MESFALSNKVRSELAIWWSNMELELTYRCLELDQISGSRNSACRSIRKIKSVATTATIMSPSDARRTN